MWEKIGTTIILLIIAVAIGVPASCSAVQNDFSGELEEGTLTVEKSIDCWERSARWTILFNGETITGPFNFYGLPPIRPPDCGDSIFHKLEAGTKYKAFKKTSLFSTSIFVECPE